MHIRVTTELLETMRQAAAHCGISVSDVVWRSARSLCRPPETEMMRERMRRVGMSLDVPHVAAPEVTRAGKREVQVRGELPPSVTSDALRQRIYDKCVAALGVRVARVETTLREGVDYLVEQNG